MTLTIDTEEIGQNMMRQNEVWAIKVHYGANSLKTSKCVRTYRKKKKKKQEYREKPENYSNVRCRQ